MFSNSNILELSDIFYKNNLFPKTKLYVVGGSVRDFLLSKTASDFDITSALTPDEVKKILAGSDFEIDSSNEKYGVLTIKKSEFKVQHSSFRVEKYALNGSHTPCEIEFTKDISKDAIRRDFTINSVYFCVRDNEFLDFFKGKEDLKKRLLKTIKKPKQSFAEDAERILRLIRFSSKLNLIMERETYKQAKLNVNLIKNISPTRLYSELSLMLFGTPDYKFIPSNIYMTFNSIVMHENFEEGGRSQFGANPVRFKNQKQAVKLLNKFKISHLLFGRKLICPKFSTSAFNFTEFYYANNNPALLNFLKEGKEKQEFLDCNKAMDAILKSTDDMFNFNVCFYYKYLFSIINILKFKLGSQSFNRLENIINEVSSKNLIISTSQLQIKGDKLLEIGIEKKRIEKIKLILLKAVVDKKVLNRENDLINYIISNDLINKGGNLWK